MAFTWIYNPNNPVYSSSAEGTPWLEKVATIGTTDPSYDIFLEELLELRSNLDQTNTLVQCNTHISNPQTCTATRTTLCSSNYSSKQSTYLTAKYSDFRTTAYLPYYSAFYHTKYEKYYGKNDYCDTEYYYNHNTYYSSQKSSVQSTHNASTYGTHHTTTNATKEM